MTQSKSIVVQSLLAWLLIMAACQKQEEIIVTSPGARLATTDDTVIFDTVFTVRGSITKRFKILNPNDNAIRIDDVYVGGGSSSPYRIIFDGRPGSRFENQVLLGGDSLLVLVEVTIDPVADNLPFLVTDSVVIESNTNTDVVKLVAWGQDANFFNDSILACNTTWTADRPYVITNSVLVNEGCTLTIEPGTQVFSANGSAILVAGSLTVNGTNQMPVSFLNDRLDEGFENAPGQWVGIFFLEGSKDNTINHAIIRNAQIGLRVGTPDNDTIADVTVNNTIIENMTDSGILGFSADITANNTLINNCAVYTVGHFIGGTYRYNHCTFANFSFDFFRDQPSVVWADNVIAGEETLIDDFNLRMFNTIIWGSLSEELLLSSTGEASFEVFLANNIIKTEIEGFDINGNIINEDPSFVDPFLYDYSLDTLSVAKDAGLVTTITTDLPGNNRDLAPDIGAYERIE